MITLLLTAIVAIGGTGIEIKDEVVYRRTVYENGTVLYTYISSKPVDPNCVDVVPSEYDADMADVLEIAEAQLEKDLNLGKIWLLDLEMRIREMRTK